MVITLNLNRFEVRMQCDLCKQKYIYISEDANNLLKEMIWHKKGYCTGQGSR